MREESTTINEGALVFPALAGAYRKLAPFGYALMRVAIGLSFVNGGVDKLLFNGTARIAAGNITALGLTPPMAWAWAVTILEFGGGILLILGLFTRLAAVALTIELTVIAFGIMALRGFFWTTGGMEVALLMEAATIAFVLGGGGRFSLDRLMGREF
jgi:putative oxidoreductase